MAGAFRYPNPPATLEDLQSAWGELIRVLDIRDAKNDGLNKVPWVLANVSVNYNFDPTTATAGQTAVALSTLLQQLKQQGKIG